MWPKLKWILDLDYKVALLTSVTDVWWQVSLSPHWWRQRQRSQDVASCRKPDFDRNNWTKTHKRDWKTWSRTRELPCMRVEPWLLHRDWFISVASVLMLQSGETVLKKRKSDLVHMVTHLTAFPVFVWNLYIDFCCSFSEFITWL